MSSLLPEPSKQDHAWVVVGIIHEAVQRFQGARSAEHLWELVTDNLRWVLPCTRAAVLLHVDDLAHQVVQRAEGGALLGPCPEPLDLRGSCLAGIQRGRRPRWLATSSMTPQTTFGSWLVGDPRSPVLIAPLVVQGDRVGTLVAATDPPEGERSTLVSAVSMYATQIAMTWRLMRYIEERTRARELELVNEELQRARDRALSASRAKSSFLANMSHELRTPLNAIIGYSELLLEDPDLLDHSDACGDLQRIHGSANHLLSLISDVLDLSKIEAGKLRLDVQAVILCTLVDDLAATAQPLAARNRNRLVAHCAEDLELVRADPLRLRQVLLNLISNACKFTVDGTVELQVVPWEVDGTPGALISVCDDGIGMNAEQLSRCFEPFEQAHQERRDRRAGTGLGLAICKRLADMMGARLELVSVPDVGTEAQLWVPHT